MDSLPTIVIGIVSLAIAVACLYLVLTRVARRTFGPPRRLERDLAIDLLTARRDRGVISAEEFETAQRIIGDG